MAGVNKVILLGNLGADPEVKHLESGSVVARIRLATSESYKNKNGERVENTEWHDIEMWEGLAKVAEQYLHQGDTIYVEGKIKSSKWEDDQGNSRRSIRIRATQMTMIKTRNSEFVDKHEKQQGATSSPSADNGNDVDTLPF